MLRNKTPYRHFFFDLDKTIWDFEANSIESLRELYKKYDLLKKGKVQFNDFYLSYEKHNKDLWDLYRRNKVTKAELSLKRFVLPLADLGLDKLVQAPIFSRDYANLITLKTRLFPNVFDTLEYLVKKYTLHIITNGFEETQKKKLNLSGLSQYFRTITTAEEAKVLKPNLKIFRYALQKADASPSESLMIGDDISVDLVPAAMIGMGTCLINHQCEPHEIRLDWEVFGMEGLMRLF